jgi:hypothetical protein
MIQVREQVRVAPWSSVWVTHVRTWVRSGMTLVESWAWSRTLQAVDTRIWGQVTPQVTEKVTAQIWTQVNSRIWEQVGSHVGSA